MVGMIRPFVFVSLTTLCVMVTASAQPQAPAPIPAPPDVAAPPADAVKTASGLASKVLQPGTGTEHAGIKNAVTVHYTAWTTDGKMFDNSQARRMPSTFLIEAVIKGWAEGVQLMTVGEKRRMWIPEELAFKGIKGRPQGMVVFDVELIDLLPDPRVAPPDAARPPDDAEKTRSGTCVESDPSWYGVCQADQAKPRDRPLHGMERAGRQDVRQFRGQRPGGNLRAGRGHQGWTEGVQLMVEGETTPFLDSGASSRTRGARVLRACSSSTSNSSQSVNVSLGEARGMGDGDRALAVVLVGGDQHRPAGGHGGVCAEEQAGQRRQAQWLRRVEAARRDDGRRRPARHRQRVDRLEG